MKNVLLMRTMHNLIESYLNNFRERMEMSSLEASELDKKMNTSEFILYTKAFRLKHFNRCPSCDEVMVFWYDVFNRVSYCRCICSLELKLEDHIIWEHQGNMDLIILEMVKGVLDGSYSRPSI